MSFMWVRIEASFMYWLLNNFKMINVSIIWLGFKKGVFKELKLNNFVTSKNYYGFELNRYKISFIINEKLKKYIINEKITKKNFN